MSHRAGREKEKFCLAEMSAIRTSAISHFSHRANREKEALAWRTSAIKTSAISHLQNYFQHTSLAGPAFNRERSIISFCKALYAGETVAKF